ncbi:hypothetical protein MN0502_16180 [Arthrobacter sp. MN05-02]|nr:hypothetical protein MN0502_16180 [Arthrobacter sp. MN05-02]
MLNSAAVGSGSFAESVIRRCAMLPIDVCEAASGTPCGHHATIGASGSRRADTSDSFSSASSP